jgi:soluble lytic murein transglycosylase-like protein
MSITILNYLDQDLVDQVNAQALLRQQAAQEAARAASEASQTDSDFATALEDASSSYGTTESSTTVCSAALDSIFQEAASTYGVSANLLKAIAHAESNFNANAVSSAGAIGIMQLMPSTAASLGVSNSYDPRENIMGGAKLIAQLLDKYNGDTSLALAAYNAGSNSVDQYGGIPPFTETQNYVKTVLSYLNGSFEVSYDTVAEEETSDSSETEQLLQALLTLRNANPDALNLLLSLLNTTAASENS